MKLLIVIMLTFPIIMAVPCTEQWECLSVSDNFNYVSCIDGDCECLSENGFLGNASSSNKCSCDEQLHWNSTTSTPYCFSLDKCGRLKHEISQLSGSANLHSLDIEVAGSYYVSGGFFNSKLGQSVSPTLPASWAIDTISRKLYFNHIVNVHYLFDQPDSRGYVSYFIVTTQNGITCYHSQNYSYTSQVENSRNEAFVDEYIDYRGERVKRYSGLRNDHHTACMGRLASSTVVDQRGVIAKWDWHVVMSVFGISDVSINQNYWIDTRNAIFGQPPEELFIVPSICDNSVDICLFTL